MATTRATFGSVLSVVTTTAGAVTSLLDNATSGLDMLSTYISVAKNEQALRAKADMLSAHDRIVAEFSMAQTVADIETLEFCAKSTQHATLYEAAQAKYIAALTAK